MTETEITRELAAKYRLSPRHARKNKLRMRYRHRLDEEIERTAGKLALLYQLRAERDRKGSK